MIKCYYLVLDIINYYGLAKVYCFKGWLFITLAGNSTCCRMLSMRLLGFVIIKRVIKL